MSKRQLRAIERLAAAQAALEAAERRWQGAVKVRGSAAEVALNAAHNELQSALWPFVSGRYPMPEGIGFGLPLH